MSCGIAGGVYHAAAYFKPACDVTALMLPVRHQVFRKQRMQIEQCESVDPISPELL